MKKNFKRLLCLVLVVSLVCTLGVTAFAANSLTAYTDVDDITYAEAVDVLTGVGILEGSDGEFRPNDTVTRAEAAKIVSYLALGADTAEALAATTAPFDDVPLTHWAVGYIAYCASAGIINGYGDGNFGPDDSVTLYELAKMLLCVEGYGVNGEYTGTAWQIQTAADAGVYGLFDGKEGAVNGTADATREETALLAFNALVNVAQAKYNETFAEYYVGSSALNAISITVKGDYQYKTYIDSASTDETAYEFTIGYQKYDLTKVNKDEDAFGRPIYAWQSDGDEISDNYVDGSADYTITGKATPKDIKSVVGSTNTDLSWSFIVDGNDTPAATKYSSIDWKDDDTALVERGQIMEVYIKTNTSTGTKYVEAVIITDYLAQVSDVSEDDGDIELTLDVYLANGKNTGLTIDSDSASNLSGYAEDDWIIVNCATDGSWSVQTVEGAATTVEGVPTAYANSAITVDGTKYNFSSTFKRTTDTGSGNGYGYSDFDDAYQDNYDDAFVLYLDTYGNLIGFEAADDSSSSAVTKNYLYVKSADADYYDTFDDAYVKIKAQFTDGTTEVVYLNVSNEDSATKASVKVPTVTGGSMPLTSATEATAIATELAGKVYAYTVNSSGYYTLKTLGTKAEQFSSITAEDKSAVTLDGSNYYATSSTKLVLVEDGKTYTGYSNFPDVDSSSSPVLAIFTNDSKTRLTYIYVFLDDVSTTEGLVYAMYKGVGDSTTDGTYREFYVGGSVVSYLFDDDEYDDSDFTTYEAGWVEIGSDGYSDYYRYSDYDTESGTYDIDDDNTDETIYYATYKNDYYIYAGVVVSKSSDSIGVDINGDNDEDFVFALADDYATTRVKTGSSRSATAANEDDYVWVFTEDEAVSNGMSAEAVAVIAVNSDITAAATYFGGLTLYTD